MYMQRTTSGAAGNGLYSTIKYMRGASGIGMGTTIKHLRCTTNGAAGNGLGETMKYLRRTTSAAANNSMSITIILLCSAASFEVNSEPHTGARPSVRLCVGPELARCVHTLMCEVRRLTARLPRARSAWAYSWGHKAHKATACTLSLRDARWRSCEHSVCRGLRAYRTPRPPVARVVDAAGLHIARLANVTYFSLGAWAHVICTS
jgi:hypothetical protein